MAYFFYIIYSKTLDKYYIGHTSDIEGRLRRHNSDHNGFTGKVNDWEFAYTENYATKTEAYRRERTVKSWKSKRLIEQLIKKKTR